jgi:hypothetical protein
MRAALLSRLPLLLLAAWCSFLLVFCSFAIITWTGMAEQDRTIGLVRVVQWACMPFTLITPDRQILEYFQPQNRWFFNDRWVFSFTLLSYVTTAAAGWACIATVVNYVKKRHSAKVATSGATPQNDA